MRRIHNIFPLEIDCLHWFIWPNYHIIFRNYYVLLQFELNCNHNSNFVHWNEQRLRRKLAASNPNPPDLTPSASLEVNVSVPPPPPPPPVQQIEEVKVPEVEQEQSKHVTVEAVPEAVPVPAQTSSLPPGVSREEQAAIKIQTAFRGYLVMWNSSWIQLSDCIFITFYSVVWEFVVAIYFISCFHLPLCWCKYYKGGCVEFFIYAGCWLGHCNLKLDAKRTVLV